MSSRFFQPIGILLVFVFLTPLFAPLKAETIPVFYVNAKNKSDTEAALNLYYSIKSKIPDFEKKADNSLALTTDQTTFDYVLVPRAQKIMENIPDEYKKYLEVLGSVLCDTDTLGDGKLSQNEAIVSNLTTDIARSTNCSSFGVFSNYSNMDSPIVGRNLDWGSNEYMRGLQAITVLKNKIGQTVVNIGFSGIASVASGFNSNGLFVAVHDSPLGNAYPGADGKRSYGFDLAYVLETCSSINEAKDFLYDKPYTYSYNILLADETDIKVLEHPQGQNGQLRAYDSTLRSELTWGKTDQLAVVNCFALEASPDNNILYAYSSTRWNRFKDLAIFNSGSPADMDDVESIMLDTANSPDSIFNSITMQSMVFSPIDRHLRLYTVPNSGTHPADPEMTAYPDLLKLNLNKMIAWNNTLVVDFGQSRGLRYYDGTWHELPGWGDVLDMIIWGDKLVVDFGKDRGLYYYDASAQLHPLSGWDTTSNMMIWNDGATDNLVVDFGTDRGIYYHNGGNWGKLTGWGDVGKMLVWDHKLVVDFDKGRGLYDYGISTHWHKLSSWDSAANMVAWNDGSLENLTVDFGIKRGLYNYKNGTWAKLSGWDSSAHMMVWNNMPVVDFGNNRGLFTYNNATSSWNRITGWDNGSDIMICGSDLIVDFGQGRGMYKNNGSNWSNLSDLDDTSDMLAWGSDIVVDFGNGRGLYEYSSGWNQLTDWDDTTDMLVCGSNLYVDFGPGRGISSYNGSTWTSLTEWSTAD